MNYDKLTNKKKLLDEHRPLSDALKLNLDDWLLIELTYTSNAIEGNTLTRRETALVVEKGITVAGKSLIEHIEASNHANAIRWVKERASSASDCITELDILKIHELILNNIDDDNAVRYRNIPVRISGSNVILPNPLKVPKLMAEFVSWLNCKHDNNPVEIAARAHYRLVSIHPFTDGNGRTARLLMNMILMMKGYPPAIIKKRERLKYITSLEKAQLGGSLDDYLKLICKAAERSLDIYLNSLGLGSDGNINNVVNLTIKQNDNRLLKIGQLAKLVGERNSTIRHWTKIGLIEVADITEAGYHLYEKSMIKRISQIHKYKKQRLTLSEIKDKLD